MIIEPTVGRIVWYYPPGVKPGVPRNKRQPLAAIVTYVWSNTCVNLAIFDENGRPIAEPPTSVLLVQEGNPRPDGGNFCEWMPYQKGQAAKTEAVEKQLAGTTLEAPTA